METLLESGTAGLHLPDALRAVQASQVEMFDPLGLADWDAMLDARGADSVFLSRGWAAVLSSTYGYIPKYFGILQNTSFQALLPVMEVDSWITGRRGVGLPFSDLCSPRVADVADFQTLLLRAISEGRRRRWRFIEIRGGGEFLENVSPYVSYFEHTVPLRNEFAPVEELKPEVRRAIQRAEREGVTVIVEQSWHATEEYYRLHCLTRNRHGVPPQPMAFFRNLWERIVNCGMGSVLLARVGRKTVAGAVFLRWGETALFKFGASDCFWHRVRPNNLLLWEAFKHYAHLGCRWISLGRTAKEDAGLRRFKLSWGAREREIRYFRFDLRHGRFIGRGEKWGAWGRKLIRRLPIPIARVVGKFAYRHVG